MSFRPHYGFLGLFGVALVLGIGAIVNGSSITLFTGPGATDSAGEPVDASATFDISAGTVKITLNNLIVNQKSIGQNISDVLFSLSNGDPTSATLTSSSGKERTVASDGTFTDGSTVDTGWEVLSDTPGLIHLSVIGTPEAPQHTIIGAPDSGGTYSNANSSIAGNSPHNPFLGETATFTLSVTGVTTATTIESAMLSFGTTPGDNVALPLPASAVGGLLLMGSLWAVRKIRQA